MPNRYESLEHHADLGEGAEEFGETRRFTRPTEKTPDRNVLADPAEGSNTNSLKEN